jgi:hypothetical protein
MTENTNHRPHGNRHLASDLRRRLRDRHRIGTAAREILDGLSDEDLLETHRRHEQQGRDHAARKRAGE